MKIFLLYLTVINLFSFTLVGIDKQRAIHQKWRIPEKSLFLSVLIGGGLGGTLGMHFFHHKTKHWYFRFGFPSITLIEAGIIFYILKNYSDLL